MKENKLLSGFMLLRLKKALVLNGLKTKNESNDLIKKAKTITTELIGKVENLNPKNPLAGNIQTAFPIIAVWLASDKTITMEEINQLIATALKSPLIKFFYSYWNFNKQADASGFLNKMKKASSWHLAHKDDSYGWDFEFDDNLHKEGCYYAFRFCPIADFCKKNGLQEIAPTLCSIDYTTFGLCRGRLIREKTLAKGDDICDFWIVGDETNPEN